MSIQFDSIIKQFGKQGEKTGWSYIEIPAEIAQKLMPGNKKSFRVKGRLDAHAIEGIALLPMGGGDFIMALKSEIRKKLKKRKGDSLKVLLELDEKPCLLCAELIECLLDEPKAYAFFTKLPGSHQNYFSKWIESAKTEQTKAKRIAQTVTAMSKGQGYSEMMRALKKERDELFG